MINELILILVGITIGQEYQNLPNIKNVTAVLIELAKNYISQN
jgi:hypothetical protein